jgi:hypothetical protein
MKLLVVALSFALIASSDIASASPQNYSNAIVGSWIFTSKVRPSRIIVFHRDGSWGVRKFDDRPEDIRGRRWRVEGDHLVLTYPDDHGFTTWRYQIVSFTPREFVTQTQGYTSTYTRLEQHLDTSNKPLQPTGGRFDD